MTAAPLDLQICAPGRADVLLSCAEHDIPWALVERLDQVGVRVVGGAGQGEPGAECAARQGCAGLIASRSPASTASVPFLHVSDGGPASVAAFLADVFASRSPIRRYAFMVGRLERDFRHAREAIRTAVEREAGICCLWADDGSHTMSVTSISERTRLLISHAAFVIADLTLGVESPDRENPSRAHEVGMAIAYERPLLLSSQEPRRYPYFSICDMQMTFWSTERELEENVTSWIRVNGSAVARRVFNYELASPRLGRPDFSYDPARRFVGPKFRGSSAFARLLARLT